MPAVKSLLLAIDLSKAQRDQAQAQLQKIMQADAFAQDQMQQLRQYAQETEARWMHNAQNSTTPELMHHHYQFMDRLNQAIKLQEGVLQGSARRVQAARQVLLKAEFRLNAYQQVLASRQLQQAKLAQRRDQKQMDEFAALQTQRQRQIQAENAP